MNRIITIGREFGSGGRELGRRLSEKLGFAYYDQEIISEIARRTEMSEQYVQSVVEHQPHFSFPIRRSSMSSLWWNISPTSLFPFISGGVFILQPALFLT